MRRCLESKLTDGFLVRLKRSTVEYIREFSSPYGFSFEVQMMVLAGKHGEHTRIDMSRRQRC